MNEKVLKQFYQLKTLDPDDYISHSIQTVDFENDQDLNKQYDLLQKLINSNSTTGSHLLNGSSKKKDDAEPLGFNESIVEELLENDIIDDSRDPSKRKYFISDKDFDAKKYLQLHQARSKNELYSRLDFLENEISARQENLDVVLHNEFVRFITIKNSLGDTMDRFEKQKDLQSFTTLGENLKQASQESDNILIPLMNAKNKESMLRGALNFVSEHKFIFNLPPNLQNDIKTKDYDSLIYDYNKGKYQYTKVLDSVERGEISESNAMLLSKIWAEVENTVNEYKKLTWDKLNNINIDNLNSSSYNISTNINSEHNYIALIYKLLELNVEDNPIIDFINIQYYKIEGEIEEIYNSYSKNISLLQKNILNTYSLESASPLSFLIRLIKDGNHLNNSDLISDLPLVQELWKLIQQFVSNFTSLVRKIVKFSSIIDFVVNGDFLQQHNEYKLKKTGNEYQMDSTNIERHLRFENYEIAKIKSQNEKLILKICDSLIAFFTNTINEFQSSSSTSMFFYSNEDIKNTPFEFGFLPPFTNAITACMQNMQLFNTISSDFQKLISSKTMISRNKTVVDLLYATCVKVNQALQSSAMTVLTYDMKYSYMLDLDDDINLIELIELYYNFYIKKASSLVYQQEISNDFKIQPSSKLLKTHESVFLKSLNFFIESNLKKNLIDDNEDAKFKTLMNFYKLQNEVKANILTRYDQSFKSSLLQQKLALFGILDNLELEIFDNLTAPITKNIISTFNSNIKVLLVSRPTGVSKLIKEIISTLVTTKVKTLHLKLPSFLSFKIISKLINDTLIKFQDFIKSSDVFDQVLVDLKFFENYFHDYLKQNDVLLKSIEKIYGILSNKVNLRSVTPAIDVVVDKAIQDSKIELD